MDTFKKYFFVLFNIIYVILGVLILLFAVWLQFGSPIHEIATDLQASKVLIYTTLGVGCLLALVGLVGLFGTCYDSKLLLLTYVAIVSLFTVGELVLGGYMVVVHFFGADNSLVSNPDVWQEFDNSTRDSLQYRFECCGFKNITAEIDENADIPCSCFIDQNNCTYYSRSNTTTDVYYQIGCIDRLEQWVSNNIYSVVAVAAVVIFFEICQIVVAALLIKEASKNQKTTPKQQQQHSDDRYDDDEDATPPHYRDRRPPGGADRDYHHHHRYHEEALPSRSKRHEYYNQAYQR